MTKKHWKLAWQRARLNRRYCDHEGYEFYKDDNTIFAGNVLIDFEFFKWGIK